MDPAIALYIGPGAAALLVGALSVWLRARSRAREKGQTVTGPPGASHEPREDDGHRDDELFR